MTEAIEGTFAYLLDQKRSAYWMKGELAAGWWGVLVGLPADEAVEAWALCARMHLLADDASPDDVLPVVAVERKLPRYYLESDDQHRGRLLNAWTIYQAAGTELAIETQLRDAGFGPTELFSYWGNPDVVWGDPDLVWGDVGAYVQFRPEAKGPRGEAAPYRTQFWVVFAKGFHPVTGGAKPWGDFVWGDTWIDVPGVWAYEGLTFDFYRTVLGIVLKWKPPEWVFRGFRFVVTDFTWGDPDFEWGDDGFVWGGGYSLDVPLGVQAPQ